MKKFILLGALSVLFYSAPGYTARRSGTEEAEMDQALEVKEARETEARSALTGSAVTKAVNAAKKAGKAEKRAEWEEEAAAARQATKPEMEALAEARREATEARVAADSKVWAIRVAEKNAKQAAKLEMEVALAEGERTQEIAVIEAAIEAAREPGPEEEEAWARAKKAAAARAAVERLDQAVAQVTKAEADWQNALRLDRERTDEYRFVKNLQMGETSEELVAKGLAFDVKEQDVKDLRKDLLKQGREERGEFYSKREEAIAALKQVVADAAAERSVLRA